MKEILAVHKRVSVSELMLQFFFLKGGILNCPKVYGLSGFYKLVSLSNIFSMDNNRCQIHCAFCHLCYYMIFFPMGDIL